MASGVARVLAGSSGSSGEQEDQTALFASCFSSILQRDSSYALCVMNSGLFELYGYKKSADAWLSPSQIQALADASASGDIDLDNIGTCRLLCTAPVMRASSSCCEAAAKLRSCETTYSSNDYCRSVIEDTFGMKKQCGVSPENTALIVCCALIFAIIAALTFRARR